MDEGNALLATATSTTLELHDDDVAEIYESAPGEKRRRDSA